MSVLAVVIILMMIGAVVALIFGVLLMAKGPNAGETDLENGRRQNKWMTYRIYFQAIAIVLLLIVFSVTKH